MNTDNSIIRSPETMEECLDDVLVSAGWGFKMGIIGGSTSHFFKSLCISPTHITAACHAACLNAPRIGGNVAAWCALYSAFSYALCSVRQKNDPWNRILAPAISSGLLSSCHFRSLRASARFTILGALFGTVQELGLIMAAKFEADRKYEKGFEEGSKDST